MSLPSCSGIADGVSPEHTVGDVVIKPEVLNIVLSCHAVRIAGGVSPEHTVGIVVIERDVLQTVLSRHAVGLLVE
jgi:hypothetical protein